MALFSDTEDVTVPLWRVERGDVTFFIRRNPFTSFKCYMVDFYRDGRIIAGRHFADSETLFFEAFDIADMLHKTHGQLAAAAKYGKLVYQR